MMATTHVITALVVTVVRRPCAMQFSINIAKGGWGVCARALLWVSILRQLDVLYSRREPVLYWLPSIRRRADKLSRKIFTKHLRGFSSAPVSTRSASGNGMRLPPVTRLRRRVTDTIVDH
jgi:hypothetical protein